MLKQLARSVQRPSSDLTSDDPDIAGVLEMQHNQKGGGAGFTLQSLSYACSERSW